MNDSLYSYFVDVRKKKYAVLTTNKFSNAEEWKPGWTNIIISNLNDKFEYLVQCRESVLPVWNTLKIGSKLA